MELGMIGLGKIGANMTPRLLHGGCRVVAYAWYAETVDNITKKGSRGGSITRKVNQKILYAKSDVDDDRPTDSRDKESNLDRFPAVMRQQFSGYSVKR